jgi:transcriptional regulator with XRE-family HTH domain
MEKRDPAIVALGHHIRKIREAHGASQEGLAAAVGITRSYYGEIERGQRNLSALYMMRIANTLKIEVGELFPPRDAFGPLLGEVEDNKAV